MTRYIQWRYSVYFEVCGNSRIGSCLPASHTVLATNIAGLRCSTIPRKAIWKNGVEQFEIDVSSGLPTEVFLTNRPRCWPGSVSIPTLDQQRARALPAPFCTRSMNRARSTPTQHDGPAVGWVGCCWDRVAITTEVLIISSSSLEFPRRSRRCVFWAELLALQAISVARSANQSPD